jgi:hypothetical protein
MTDPLTFDSATARHALPLLFPGQTQKEFYLNEAHALIDALLHCAVEDVAQAPPPAPQDGACWLVGEAPAGAWADQAGKLACRQLGNWLFISPRDGLTVLNGASGQIMRFAQGGWAAPVAPIPPAGGTTIDSELRIAFSTLLGALSAAGIFATP